MKRHNLMKNMVFGLAVLIGTSCWAAKAEDVLIGDGSGLDNWTQTGQANWRVEDGVIVADAGSGLLVSKESYGDFRLVAEFWADHTTNSGIFIRVSDPESIHAYSAYEVNIYDQRYDPSYGTGAIVGTASVEPMPKCGGQWNHYEIIAKGKQLTVRLNGQETVNVQDDEHKHGPIALQIGRGGGGKTGAIKWRKVTVEAL